MIFCISNGSVSIGGKAGHRYMSSKDVVDNGFAFGHAIDTKTGCIFSYSAPDTLGGIAVVPSLGFQNDQIKMLAATLLDKEDNHVSAPVDRHINSWRENSRLHQRQRK